MSVTASGPTVDRVFAAFCAAGLWPGLGKRTAADLPAAIRTALEDVSAPPFSYPERRSER